MLLSLVRTAMFSFNYLLCDILPQLHLIYSMPLLPGTLLHPLMWKSRNSSSRSWQLSVI